jgi:hypothetical protein
MFTYSNIYGRLNNIWRAALKTKYRAHGLFIYSEVKIVVFADAKLKFDNTILAGKQAIYSQLSGSHSFRASDLVPARSSNKAQTPNFKNFAPVQREFPLAAPSAISTARKNFRGGRMPVVVRCPKFRREIDRRGDVAKMP